jgi:membrane protease YdiL (CAAX protease family)
LKGVTTLGVAVKSYGGSVGEAAEGATGGGRDAVGVGRSRSLAACEIASVAASALVAEWAVIAAVGFRPGWFAVPVGLAFALMIYSHRLRGETAREIGWNRSQFLPALKLLVVPMLAGALALALFGRLWLGSGFRVGDGRAGWAVLGFPVWGFLWGLLQQYVLQGFVNRRAQILFGRGTSSVLLTASVFALLHLPNPWLTAATFAGGVLWAWAYQRAPNLFALALSHAAMTWVLVSALPESALRGLRVGFKYFN